MVLEKGLIGFSGGSAPVRSLTAKVGIKPPPPPEMTLREEIIERAREEGASKEQIEFLQRVDPENPPARPPPGWPEDLEWPFADRK